LDRGVEMQNVKDELRKGLKKGDEEAVKELVTQYKKLNDTQKEEFRRKLGSMLKQKYPELFEKYKEQWHLK
jgi:ABC-type transporter MlaC component